MRAQLRTKQAKQKANMFEQNMLAAQASAKMFEELWNREVDKRHQHEAQQRARKRKHLDRVSVRVLRFS